VALLGFHEFEAALEKVIAQADAGARASVVKGVAEVEAAAKKRFSGSHGKGQPHVGGDQPNVVTGTLRRSITHDPVSRGAFAEYFSRVGPTTVYARRVELGWSHSDGTRGHQITRPFPYFIPGYDEARRKFADIAAQSWRTFMRL
jgi:hypothetical protein